MLCQFYPHGTCPNHLTEISSILLLAVQLLNPRTLLRTVLRLHATVPLSAQLTYKKRKDTCHRCLTSEPSGLQTCRPRLVFCLRLQSVQVLSRFNGRLKTSCSDRFPPILLLFSILHLAYWSSWAQTQVNVSCHPF